MPLAVPSTLTSIPRSLGGTQCDPDRGDPALRRPGCDGPGDDLRVGLWLLGTYSGAGAHEGRTHGYSARMDDRQTDARRRHIREDGGEEFVFNRALGVNLRERRTKAGLTQDQLAVQAGLTRGSIANIERGEQVPGLFRLTVICSALNCELPDVLPSGEAPAQMVADSLGGRYSTAVQRARQESLKRLKVKSGS